VLHGSQSSRRAGFVQREVSINLPTSVDLLHEWEVMESAPVAPLWDFLWNTSVEEGREKNLLRYALTVGTEEMCVPKDIQSDAVHVAESAVKARSSR
jgi:oxalate---CoA ligase